MKINDVGNWMGTLWWERKLGAPYSDVHLWPTQMLPDGFQLNRDVNDQLHDDVFDEFGK